MTHLTHPGAERKVRRSGRLVRGQSLPSAVFSKWEQPVPFVPPSLLTTSIFLYGSVRDAISGANWGGSGFLFGLPSRANPSRTHLYAVSNDHVIHSCPVVRLVKATGEPYVLPGTDADWQSHPAGDDIAIRSLGAVPNSEFGWLWTGLILGHRDIDQEGIGPGDDCMMIGRYVNQEQRQFDRPAVRFGNLAMMPELIHNSDRSFNQESFLVDMRSHSGFSGSPVIVYFEEPGWRKLPPLSEGIEDDIVAKAKAMEERTVGRPLSGIMGKMWLLGIDWGHLPIWDDVFDDHKRIIARMRVNSGIAAVVPAWKLLDLLDEDAVAMARDTAEEEIAKVDEGAAIQDMARGTTASPTSGMLGKLLRVPKDETDEVHRDHQT
jgi:hypothetical protein